MLIGLIVLFWNVLEEVILDKGGKIARHLIEEIGRKENVSKTIIRLKISSQLITVCLLYTSDAADD